MRMLILGGDGMLGHELSRSWRARHEVWSTLRQAPEAYASRPGLLGERTLCGVDVRRLDDVVDALATARPQLVVNGVGLVKQRPEAADLLPSMELNALFPHRLARVCAAVGARLVHLSTDCVFSGARGRYTENDAPDPVDVYGRTKLLGEVTAPGVLTLRTSIVGLELFRASGLVEWFLAQRGTVRGWRRALWSGLTTEEMARTLERLALEAPDLQGVWHLSAEPISKYDLLAGLARRLGRTDVEVVPDDAVACDRSLDSGALRERTGWRPPPWDRMLDELAERIRRRQGGEP